MTLPFASLGIHLSSCKVTKKQLKEWTDSRKPHIVVLFSLGGIFTSEGDGVYTSFKYKFDTTEEFWQFARQHRQGATMSVT